MLLTKKPSGDVLVADPVLPSFAPDSDTISLDSEDVSTKGSDVADSSDSRRRPRRLKSRKLFSWLFSR